MYALIETIGKAATINLFDDLKDLEKEMILRYNAKLRESSVIDWKRTGFWLDELYGRVRDEKNIVEWRVGEIR